MGITVILMSNLVVKDIEEMKSDNFFKLAGIKGFNPLY